MSFHIVNIHCQLIALHIHLDTIELFIIAIFNRVPSSIFLRK